MNPYFYDGVAPELVWTEFWRRWDFNGWIKPMIDDAASIGANAVRIFGNTNVVTSGAISLDEYLRRWKQVLEYATAKNLYVMPCGGDLSHWGRLTTRASAEQIYRSWAGLLSNYPRVVGIDVTNEASDQSQTMTPLSYSQPETVVGDDSDAGRYHSVSIPQVGHSFPRHPFQVQLAQRLRCHRFPKRFSEHPLLLHPRIGRSSCPVANPLGFGKGIGIGRVRNRCGSTGL